MSTLGSMVSNAVDAYNGESGQSTLQDFLSKFGSTKGRYVDSIDPMHTFDVKFQFYPTLTYDELMAKNSKQKLSGLDAALASVKNSALKMGENALDNATGGLFSAIMDSKKDSVLKQHDKFEEKYKHTFLEYLMQAHFLQGGEQWQSPEQNRCPLEMQMGFYIQSITIPNLKQGGDGKAQSLFGDFATSGRNIDSDGTLTMSILNTKASLHERVFYPWMREVTTEFWQYDSQPYTTANIIVDFSKHNDVKYIFTGCRPIQINMMQASQALDSSNITRDVSFAYDFMFITSKLKVNDTWQEKLVGSLAGIAKGASSMMNMK